MSAAPRTLGDLGLGPAAAGPAADPAAPVTGIAVDSRVVRQGCVFVAVAGTRLDGAEFAQYAIRQGAAAIVASAQGLATIRATLGAEPGVPVIVVPEPRAELARLAALWHGAQPGICAAVTGTNGKTSVAQFLRAIWAAAGHPSAALGTLGVTGRGFDGPLGHTTPEPLTLHAALARITGLGCTHAVLEASSHGLAQHRVDGVRLAAAGFTNLTRDHMDYHPTHADYVAAKMRLFEEVLPAGGAAVWNADDPLDGRIAEIAARRGLRAIRVGRAEDADLRLAAQRFTVADQEIALDWQGTRHAAALGLVGDFQAENVGIAAGLALASGVPAGAVFAALPGLEGVPGRMERVARRRNGAAVYVDYAHTPDALAAALSAIRPHCAGRLVVVFGAGGGRDPGKRRLMGEAVARGADIAFVTDDNPRDEDPATIRRAVLAGCPEASEIADRAAAILAGVDALEGPGDVLLVAGKGHEQGQEIAGETRPFDDGAQARAAVAALDGVTDALGSGQDG